MRRTSHITHRYASDGRRLCKEPAHLTAAQNSADGASPQNCERVVTACRGTPASKSGSGPARARRDAARDTPPD